MEFTFEEKRLIRIKADSFEEARQKFDMELGKTEGPSVSIVKAIGKDGKPLESVKRKDGRGTVWYKSACGCGMEKCIFDTARDKARAYRGEGELLTEKVKKCRLCERHHNDDEACGHYVKDS